jgi:hypothetical protein
MYWKDLKEKWFPNKTTTSLNQQWLKMEKVVPKLLDATVPEDVIVREFAQRMQLLGWSQEADARLVETKRLHPYMKWDEFKKKVFPNRAESSIRKRWRELGEVDPKLREFNTYKRHDPSKKCLTCLRVGAVCDGKKPKCGTCVKYGRDCKLQTSEEAEEVSDMSGLRDSAQEGEENILDRENRGDIEEDDWDGRSNLDGDCALDETLQSCGKV